MQCGTFQRLYLPPSLQIRHVSLCRFLPSATSYEQKVVQRKGMPALKERPDSGKACTTGHVPELVLVRQFREF